MSFLTSPTFQIALCLLVLAMGVAAGISWRLAGPKVALKPALGALCGLALLAIGVVIKGTVV